MKKGFLSVLVLLMALSFWQCNSTSNSDTADGESQSDSAKIEFENPNHDFGEIKEGEVVSTVFKFKNVGSMPLNIVSVDVTCGCTVAEKPEKPIGAGKTGEIKVEFNSAGKAGINKKYVTVTSNAVNASEVVSFDVIVNKNEQ
ncbi:DUF1573 domain-containing protein [Lacihabitans sp. CCS-44]|uniref:DUF1573 domain-containing protein n=1 Tax=Lacihabitans sp. CCS-44 TaxID=2487331 RepID=UPI0020CD4CBB|nr:DUF1573 domain-containing protein [Lacihabitans sp. CCS-44]MCP9756303.1 DUF1573 domain-containing protein [Lacihabitans sp. CCS-44]